MSWTITSGPTELPNGHDATRWLWEISDTEGATRKLTVGVSGTAMTMGESDLSDRVIKARSTQGRSEVEALLSQVDPDHEISLHSTTPD